MMGRAKKFIIFLIMVFIINTPCYAKEQKISLTDAVNLAIGQNIDISQKRLNINISKNNLKISGRLQNPNIDAYLNQGKATRGNPQQVGVSEVIELFKRGPRKNVAKAQMELTKDMVNFNEFDLRMDTRQAYINLVAAKSVLKIQEDQRTLFQELLRISQKKVQVGVAPEMDLIQARIVLNQVNAHLNNAKAQVQATKYNFNKVLNIKNTDDVVYDTKENYLPSQKDFMFLLTPSPGKKMPQFSNIVDVAYKKRYDIKIAQEEINLAQKNLTLVIRQRIPDIAVGVGYAFQPPSLNPDGNDFLSGAYVSGSIVNLPLLYNYSPEIKNAKIQLEQAQLNYDSTKNKAVKDLRTSYELFLTAQANLNYYNKELIKDSDELMKLSKRSYEMGKSDLTSLIVVEQSYKTILTDYTSALVEYYDCWINFIREVNDESFSLEAENV